MLATRFALVLVLATAATLTAQDRIELVSGDPITGVKVTEESFRKVSYEKAGGGKGSVPVSRVADIVRSGGPDALRQGRSALLEGRAEDATRLLSGVVADSAAPGWAREYAAFFLGEAEMAKGDGRAAVQAFEKVVSINAESRLLPHARLGRARAHALAGDATAAAKACGDFEAEARDKRLGEDWILRAKITAGSVQETAGDFAAAAREYGSLAREVVTAVGKAEKPEDKAALERLGLEAERRRGEALVRSGNLNEAQSTFSGILSKHAKVPGAKAIAAAGQARVALARGEADKARVDLAKVVATALDAGEAEPWFLLCLAEAYAKLAEGGEAGARDKAQTYIQILVQRWPGSGEARLARDLQQRL